MDVPSYGRAAAVRDLIDGIAFDINARGQVVGASGDFGAPEAELSFGTEARRR